MKASTLAEEIAALREQRWSMDDARKVLGAYKNSGLSLSAFSRKHELHPERLSWWRKRLHKCSAPATEASAVRFAPAVVLQSATAAAITVRLPGVLVEISDGSNAKWVASLLRELQESAS